MDRLVQPSPDLGGLFDPDGPGMPMLFAALDGRNPADFRVDRLHRPTQCAVRNGVMMTFASRGISQAFLEEAVADLRQTRGVALVEPYGPQERWRPVPGATEIERLEFRSFDADAAGFRETLAEPLDGMELRLIDRESLTRSLWKDTVLAFTGTVDGFLQHGFGLHLCRGDEVLAEGDAVVLGRSVMEVGVITAEAHRGRGYARLVSAHLVERCLEKGYGVFWSCELDNPASAAIARRLGFTNERAYRLHGYPPSTRRPEGNQGPAPA